MAARLDIVACVAISLLCLVTAGCGSADSQSSVPRSKSNGIDSAAYRWERPATSLDHLGPIAEAAPGEILRRDMTIETDDVVLTRQGSVLTRGPAGVAIIDPESGRLLFRAKACSNPSCQAPVEDGGPFIFVAPVDSQLLNDDGTPRGGLPASVAAPRCPRCDDHRMVDDYLLPEVAARQAELDEELMLARKARRQFGRKPAVGVRTPMEIVRERALLPRLYLPAD